MSNDDTNANDNLKAVNSFDDLNSDSDDLQQVDSFSDLQRQASDGDLDYLATDSFDALNDGADSSPQAEGSSNTSASVPKNKWRFSEGILLLDDGGLDEPEFVVEFLSSNGTTVYTAIRWKASQLISCNCPGWAFKRECKHSKEVLTAKESSYLNRETAARDDVTTIGESPTTPAQDAEAHLLAEDESPLHDLDFGDDEPVSVETKQPATPKPEPETAVPHVAAAESESAAVSSEIPEVPACTRLVISPSPSSVMAGEQVIFSVEAFDNNGDIVEEPDVRWTAKGGAINEEGAFTADVSGGLFSVKASTAGASDRVEGVVEALPVQNEWVLASFFSACGIYLALAMIYFLDPAVLGPSKNFIGYINFDWAIATILVGPCLICFISSSLGLLSKPKGKEWLLLLPSLGPVIPVVLGAVSVIAFF